MKLHILVLLSFALAQPAAAQTSRISVTGDAAVTVAPDRVRLFLGVESRNSDLLAAKAENDARVSELSRPRAHSASRRQIFRPTTSRSA